MSNRALRRLRQDQGGGKTAANKYQRKNGRFKDVAPVAFFFHRIFL